jgi:hypothetical protein
VSNDGTFLSVLLVGLVGMSIVDALSRLGPWQKGILLVSLIGMIGAALIFLYDLKSKAARERKKRIQAIKEIPPSLLSPSKDGIFVGQELDLGVKIYLPDAVRSKHVHVLGSTGSGKTESVVLNFLKQDVARGIGSIILDAKGDTSFKKDLASWIPPENLLIFDLSSETSSSYDPLSAGTALESAQRLFSSLVWSEEYYKGKALSALQRIFASHRKTNGSNPQLSDITNYLTTSKAFSAITASDEYDEKVAEKDFLELSGLRDQVRGLCTDHLVKILSPTKSQIDLANVGKGSVIYFRLQSLLSPQLALTVGRLVINHLNYLVGSQHRDESENKKFTSVYLDEFARFACPEFANLASMARSAGFALHFSHQSIGDLKEVSEGFLSTITDNSSTKIVMRINDPDSADYFARAFGTKMIKKLTHRVTNSEEVDTVQVSGDGSLREVHQFRAPPDLFKTHPTGVGSILISHGDDTPHGASSVFRIKFPAKEKPKQVSNSTTQPQNSSTPQ